jgi:uncharacterized peroxidase-related enzyme
VVATSPASARWLRCRTPLQWRSSSPTGLGVRRLAGALLAVAHEPSLGADTGPGDSLSAPANSTASLRALEQGLGFVPDLAATMAESPALISGFVDLRKTLAGGDLNGVEREIVALAVSLENDCDYCMAAHSTFALMQNADEDAVSTARRGDEPADPKLGALYRFTRSLVAKKGHLGAEELQALLDAGYSRRALLDVVAQVGHTTLANLAHGLSQAPLDDAFTPQAWAKAVA